jgi:N,N-dimethylformamidase
MRTYTCLYKKSSIVEAPRLSGTDTSVPGGEPTWVAPSAQLVRHLGLGNVEPMRVVGYLNRLSVEPGEELELKVSCLEGDYRASVVRLIHGDLNPAGPGWKSEDVETELSGTYPGREQTYAHGSFVRVEDESGALYSPSFSVHAWILATTPYKGEQGILSRFRDGVGYALVVGAAGDLGLWVGDGTHLSRFETGGALRPEWTFVAASYDGASGTVHLLQLPRRTWPDDPASVAVSHRAGTEALGNSRSAFMIGALEASDGAVGAFNGKIDDPCLHSGALDLEELRRCASEEAHSTTTVRGAWNLGANPSSDLVPDFSGNGRDGKAINLPMRAVTGHRWTGEETDYKLAPNQYTAMHFHDDDLEDAGWKTDASFRVPEGLRSGIYAAHLEAGDAEDYVPFFVRPRNGAPTARVAVLLPTFTYLAYANEHVTWMSIGSPPPYEGIDDNLQSQDHYAVKHRLLSLYDLHDDGSGVCYSSTLRPIVNMRPKYSMALLRSPHLLNADLHLTDWLETKGVEFDVFTDHDLDHDGLDLLRSYRVLLTGSHPEYWSGQMLDALETWLDDGGRLMYLGANGFYWVTSVDPNRPHIVEVRRGHVGTATWRSEPGEEFHAGTGERGGLWRFRGRAPQVVSGIGYAATGYSADMPPYRRTAESFEPRVSWIFDGVGANEPIGDAGLVLNGAAGFEIDRTDTNLGTPPHAVVVARATGYTDGYQAVSEDITVSDSLQGGTVNSNVRADMVYYEGPNAGAVFSTGAISWCGSLSWNGYENNVSRITGNVLERFMAD